jgi:hypothetical protein
MSARIADSFDGFVEKTSAAIRVALNSPVGQEMTQKLLEMKLAQNPRMTSAEWEKTKSEFMTFLFCQFVQDTPRCNEGACRSRVGRIAGG